MTLDQAPAGDGALVRVGDVLPGLRRRLAELGIRDGERVVPLGRTAGGGRIVAIGHARVALSRSVLRSISVETA